METIPAFARHDLTDEQWALLEPLLPIGRKPGRPPVHDKRRLIDGIRWRTRAGVPWRDVPAFYGPWQACTGSFAAGSSTGCGPGFSPRSSPARMRRG